MVRDEESACRDLETQLKEMKFQNMKTKANAVELEKQVAKLIQEDTDMQFCEDIRETHFRVVESERDEALGLLEKSSRQKELETQRGIERLQQTDAKFKAIMKVITQEGCQIQDVGRLIGQVDTLLEEVRGEGSDAAERVRIIISEARRLLVDVLRSRGLVEQTVGDHRCKSEKELTEVLEGDGVEFVAHEAVPDCPDRHGLDAFTTPEDGFACDVCGKVVSSGTSLYSCGRCEYDLCPECYRSGAEAIDWWRRKAR
jgi:hypothetical protein